MAKEYVVIRWVIGKGTTKEAVSEFIVIETKFKGEEYDDQYRKATAIFPVGAIRSEDEQKTMAHALKDHLNHREKVIEEALKLDGFASALKF